MLRGWRGQRDTGTCGRTARRGAAVLAEEGEGPRAQDVGASEPGRGSDRLSQSGQRTSDLQQGRRMSWRCLKPFGQGSRVAAAAGTSDTCPSSAPAFPCHRQAIPACQALGSLRTALPPGAWELSMLALRGSLLLRTTGRHLEPGTSWDPGHAPWLRNLGHSLSRPSPRVLGSPWAG